MMTQTINLILKGKKLSVSNEDSNSITLVSANDSFMLHLSSDLPLPNAVFARFTSSDGYKGDMLLDLDGCCKVPMAALLGEYVEVGFYSTGFATSVLKLNVNSSVLSNDEIQLQQPVPSQTEQLISLVNTIPLIRSAVVNEDKMLLIYFADGRKLVAGYVDCLKGDSYTLSDLDKDEIAQRTAELIDSKILDALGSGVVL